MEGTRRSSGEREIRVGSIGAPVTTGHVQRVLQRAPDAVAPRRSASDHPDFDPDHEPFAVRIVPRLLVSLVLVPASAPLSAVPAQTRAAESYESVAVDSGRVLHVRTRDGRHIVITPDSEQVGVEQVAISRDRHAVGWLALYPNCCTSYAIPLALRTYSGGKLRSSSGNGLPVWHWRFEGDGARVSLYQETVHGSSGAHYELRDVRTGRLIAQYEPADSAPPPSWVVRLRSTDDSNRRYVDNTITARAQSMAPTPRWELTLGARLSAPDGWIRVREDQIEGTRLHVRSDLGVHDAHATELALQYRVSDRSALRLSVESNALDGRALLPADVVFNGATIARGTVLETRTHFPSFVRFTVAGERRLHGIGRSGSLSAMAGLTYVSLTFQLRGTLAPTTVGGETKEDFVTQELPVPLLGLALDYPLRRRLAAHVGADGGYLPWMYSLRNEGGHVGLKQTHLDLDAGVRYALTTRLRAEGGYHYGYYEQREKSREDGNDILLRESGLRLAVTLGF